MPRGVEIRSRRRAERGARVALPVHLAGQTSLGCEGDVLRRLTFAEEPLANTADAEIVDLADLGMMPSGSITKVLRRARPASSITVEVARDHAGRVADHRILDLL